MMLSPVIATVSFAQSTPTSASLTVSEVARACGLIFPFLRQTHQGGESVAVPFCRWEWVREPFSWPLAHCPPHSLPRRWNPLHSPRPRTHKYAEEAFAPWCWHLRFLCKDGPRGKAAHPSYVAGLLALTVQLWGWSFSPRRKASEDSSTP